MNKKYEEELYQLQKSTKKLESLLRGLRRSGLEEFMTYMASPWKVMLINFGAGVFRGLGFLFGMTVIMALLIWTTSLFVDFPIIGKYFFELKSALETIANVVK